MLVAANLRLLSPAFLRWLFHGVSDVVRREAPPGEELTAELFILTVSPTSRGLGLAPQLVTALEGFFREHQLRAPYAILTEEANTDANRFYRKIGARFVRTKTHHGRKINEWHKSLP